MAYKDFRKTSLHKEADCYAANPATPATQADEARSRISRCSGVAAGMHEDAPLAETVTAYLEHLKEVVVLDAPDLPPVPPRDLPPDLRAKAWAAWWTAVDRQRKRRARMN